MQLKLGDHSTAVAVWQVFLVKCGFRITPDGHFGPKTLSATRLFQLDRQLERADGIVGPRTIEEAMQVGFAGFPGETPKPIAATPAEADKLVLISAGHTNDPKGDRGAAGSGFIEGVEAVRLRDDVAAFLRDLGVSVLEDGADGVSEPLTRALVLARKADIAVEFHFNASSNPAATGVECLAKMKHRPLAQKLAKAVADVTGLKLRGGDGGYKRDDSGQHHRLAFCEAGGLILELCFISNADDMSRYSRNFAAISASIAAVLAE